MDRTELLQRLTYLRLILGYLKQSSERLPQFEFNNLTIESQQIFYSTLTQTLQQLRAANIPFLIQSSDRSISNINQQQFYSTLLQNLQQYFSSNISDINQQQFYSMLLEEFDLVYTAILYPSGSACSCCNGTGTINQ